MALMLSLLSPCCLQRPCISPWHFHQESQHLSPLAHQQGPLWGSLSFVKIILISATSESRAVAMISLISATSESNAV